MQAFQSLLIIFLRFSHAVTLHLNFTLFELRSRTSDRKRAKAIPGRQRDNQHRIIGGSGVISSSQRARGFPISKVIDTTQGSIALEGLLHYTTTSFGEHVCARPVTTLPFPHSARSAYGSAQIESNLTARSTIKQKSNDYCQSSPKEWFR